MQAEQAIETSLLLEAEMVFTTLSSTQRKIFQLAAAQVPFRTGEFEEGVTWERSLSRLQSLLQGTHHGPTCMACMTNFNTRCHRTQCSSTRRGRPRRSRPCSRWDLAPRGVRGLGECTWWAGSGWDV